MASVHCRGHLRQREQIVQRHRKCLSWLRAMRWSLCSLEYIFSAEVCLLNCCLDSLPLHFSVFCLQGQTVLVGPQKVWSSAKCSRKVQLLLRRKRYPVREGWSQHVASFHPRSSSPEEQVHKGSQPLGKIILVHKNSLSENTRALHKYSSS